MSIEYSPVHNVAYHLVCYDASGRERSGEHGLASDQLLAAIADERPTDVFIFSHGWNGDPEGAVAQYGRWVDTMAAQAVYGDMLRAQADGFRPALVGLHWPSKAWADEELSSLSYGVTESATTQSVVEPAGDPAQRLAADYADRLGDGPEAREAIRTIVDSAFRDAAPPTLPDDVREAYRRLDASLGRQPDGVGAAPGDDRDEFDSEDVYQTALLMDVVDPLPYGGFTLGGVLAPLRVVTFWEMKRRACSFGETGAAALLGRLQQAAPGSRFHIMGHSFGCIVASAAVAGPPGMPGSRQAVDTLILAQGALSLWSFCSDIPSRSGRAGYFRRVIADRLVRGPTIVTTSTHDRAVRVFYPLGAGARRQVAYADEGLPVYGGVGTFGIRGPGIQIHDEVLKGVDEVYEFQPGAVNNLNADAVIAISAGISGAHSDICHPEVAHAVWSAVAAAT
jgi:hypothetical protein